MKGFICNECGTYNEQEYSFCKNCGEKLTLEKSETKNNTTPNSNFEHKNKINSDKKCYDNFAGRRPEENSTNQQEITVFQQPFITDNIDGVPTDDIVTFLGIKSINIVPKFSKMQLTGNKITWCWPVAIWGFLFGPIGAAVWFFYRKMYKVAAILVALGLILGSVTAIYNSFVDTSLKEAEIPIVDIIPEEVLSKFEITHEELRELYYWDFYHALDYVISVATMALCGLFGYYIYKKFTVQKINEYKLRNVESRYYQLGLASIGGTSSGMACLGVFIFIFANTWFDNVSNFITSIINLG